MNARAYYFLRNLSAVVLGIVVMPIYHLLYAAESIWDGLKSLDGSGSTIIEYPWEYEWPLFREDS